MPTIPTARRNRVDSGRSVHAMSGCDAFVLQTRRRGVQQPAAHSAADGPDEGRDENDDDVESHW